MSPPPFGVYTPLVTYFNPDESLDLASTQQHALRMAKSGVVGLVIQGSNGEAPHLLHSERIELVSTIRKTLNEHNFPSLALIVGCGAPSVRETLLHLQEAKAAGADYGLVLPPAYWTAAMSVPVVEKFFTDVATTSPLPFLIYNFPGVTAGIDVSSDSITRLALAHPSIIIGAKLTCGNVGKLQRIASSIPRSSFAALAGKSDFCLPALVAGSSGVIAALANVVPKVHVELLRLWTEGKLQEAMLLQDKLSHADWALQKLGVAGVKTVVEREWGYGSGRSRRPLGNGGVASQAEDAEKLEVVLTLEKAL